MNSRLFLSYTLLCAILCSCVKEIDETPSNDNAEQDETEILTRSTSERQAQQNPYRLSVMQSVYDTYSSTPTQLETTDLYVRFLPADSLQLQSLYDDYALELFDYPLDIELEEGEVYVDPTITEGDFTWLYTTVEPDFVFPQDIQYEIIEECYIPEDDEEIVMTKGGTAVNVEEAAFLSLGYTPEVTTKGLGVAPKGTIRVEDNHINQQVPVKGVKVRCHTFVKWGTAYTDQNGKYTINKKFLVGPHYALVFENNKGFDIWGNWGPIARANANMGWHSRNGYSKDISSNSKEWAWAAVNNAGYDYYTMCESTGILKPPTDLKIWVWKGCENSSAPMLRHIDHGIGFNGHSDICNFFINMLGYGVLATELNQMLKFLLPDITIGTKNGDYESIFDAVNHELAHASHFKQVGSAFWAKYVSYIMTYGAYGDGTGKNAELCGIGEMWGYSIGHINCYEKYNVKLPKEYPYIKPDGWIAPGVFWKLYHDGSLTKKQIYDCLSTGIETYDDLVSKMYNTYPDVADSIEVAFRNNGIIPNVNKPGTYDTWCINQVISSSCKFSGDNVFAQNVTVKSGATLTLHGPESVTINSPFTVEKGANLEITR